MHRARAAAVAVLIALSGCRPAPDAKPHPGAVPVDVAEFIARRDACDTLLDYRPVDTEDMHDATRDRSAMCDGQKEQIAALRQAYADDPPILKALLRGRSRLHDGR